MTGPSYDVLDVRLEHRVHAGLTIDVDFRLGREIGVIFGASGAGKTTILRLIAGLARPDSGRIQLGERDAVRLVASGRSSAAPSPDRDDLPGRPALPAPDRGRQHPVRTQGVATSGGRRPAGRGGRSLRRRTVDGSVAGAAVGRRAAACRPGTGPGTPPSPAPLRRTGLRARPGQSPCHRPAASGRSRAPWRSPCSTSLTASPRPSPWARGCSCWNAGGSSPTGPPLDVLADGATSG